MTCLKVQDVVDFYFRLEGISDKENLNMRNTSGFTWQLTLLCVCLEGCQCTTLGGFSKFCVSAAHNNVSISDGHGQQLEVNQ